MNFWNPKEKISSMEAAIGYAFPKDEGWDIKLYYYEAGILAAHVYAGPILLQEHALGTLIETQRLIVDHVNYYKTYSGNRDIIRFMEKIMEILSDNAIDEEYDKRLGNISVTFGSFERGYRCSKWQELERELKKEINKSLFGYVAPAGKTGEYSSKLEANKFAWPLIERGLPVGVVSCKDGSFEIGLKEVL
jgi:hypothetical protein